MNHQARRKNACASNNSKFILFSVLQYYVSSSWLETWLDSVCHCLQNGNNGKNFSTEFILPAWSLLVRIGGSCALVTTYRSGVVAVWLHGSSSPFIQHRIHVLYLHLCVSIV